MNYSHHYEKLILRAKERVLQGYSERHHIIPKCLGGSNYADNMIKLTAEEHYVAHQLLIKIYPNHIGIIFAAMSMSANYTTRRFSNKIYGWLRKKWSTSIAGENNPNYGNFWSEEQRASMSNKQSGKKMPQSMKDKISVIHKGKPKSKEHNLKNSQSQLGENNHMFGKIVSDETKSKISISGKGKNLGKKRPDLAERNRNNAGRIPWNKGVKRESN